MRGRAVIRVDAENVRDIALAASGLLVRAVRRTQLRPSQPEGYSRRSIFPSASTPPRRRQQYRRRRLHPLAANVPAPEPGHLRRAVARRMHRQSRQFEYAAAGAGAVERSDLRRGRPGVWRKHIADNGRASRTRSTGPLRERWPLSRQRPKRVLPELDLIRTTLLSSHRPRRAELLSDGESPHIANADTVRVAPADCRVRARHPEPARNSDQELSD